MISKWALPIVGLVTVTLFSAACNTAERPDDVNNRQNNALYEQGGNYYGNRYISNENGRTINNNGLGPRNDPTRAVRGQNEIGFVRVNSANAVQDNGAQAQQAEFHVDRHALANQIGSLVTAYPEINDALVLVTDDHVFVGVNDNADDKENTGDKLDDKTVDKVRQTALSVTPRYYEVHVTDDDTMRRHMTDIGDRMTNPGNANYRQEISDILRQMGDDTPPRPSVNSRGTNVNDGISEFDDAGTGGRMKTGGNNW